MLFLIKKEKGSLSLSKEIMAKLLSFGSIVHCRAPNYLDCTVFPDKHVQLSVFGRIVSPA